MLTGKAKESFLQYYWENKIKPLPMTMCRREDLESFFNSIQEITKHALIIEWLDTVDIYVNALRYDGGRYWKPICNHDMEIRFKNRKSAINSGIIKAVEIYNSKQ